MIKNIDQISGRDKSEAHFFDLKKSGAHQTHQHHGRTTAPIQQPTIEPMIRMPMSVDFVDKSHKTPYVEEEKE